MNQNPSNNLSISPPSGAPPDAVSRRAYELWEQEGRPDGSDMRHWLQAEQELGGDGAASSESQARQQASDSRPLQGTRAAAAANREPRRLSNSPFTNDKSGTNGGIAAPRRRT